MKAAGADRGAMLRWAADLPVEAFTVLALLYMSGSLLLFGNSAAGADSGRIPYLIQNIIYLVSGGLLVLSPPRMRRNLPATAILWVIPLLAVFSAAWSQAPEFTLRRSITLVGTTLFAVFIAVRFNLAGQLRMLAMALGLAMLLSLAIVVVEPQLGVHQEIHRGAWRGIYVHKNLLARVATLSCLVFAVRLWGGSGWHVANAAGALLSLTALIGTTSQTGLAVLTLLLALMPLCWTVRRRPQLAIPIVTAASLIALVIGRVLLANPERLLNTLGRDVTLTGRTQLWAVVQGMISQHPLLGFGYHGFWRPGGTEAAVVVRLTGWAMPHAHNGFLDVVLDLGLVGLVLVLAGLVVGLVAAVRWLLRAPSPLAAWPFLFLVFVIAYNLTEGPLLRQNNVVWVTYATILTVLLATPLPRENAGGPPGGR